MKNKQIIIKMVKYIDNIEKYTENISYEEFIKNNMLIDACVFNISQIGELTKNISQDFIEKYEYIPWRQMYGL